MVRRNTSLTASPTRPMSPLEALFHRAAERVAELAGTVLARRDARTLIAAVEEELATLPLAADEYSLARCRLDNALRYAHHGEPAAAGYELRLMARCLYR